MTHYDAIQVFSKTLNNLQKWMEKAEALAKEKSFDVNVLIDARLAPDQFTFVKQVQAGCDQAKYTALYLGGQALVPDPDIERTFDELRQRISKCITLVDGIAEKNYEGGEERKVSPPWLGGAWLRGDDYFAHMAIPNFYFHMTMAYAILRHNGVPLSKMDYIGSMPIKQG